MRHPAVDHPASKAAIVVVAGILFGLAQPPSSAWALGYVCLVPWLLASRSASVGGGAALGLIFGTVGGAWVASWIPRALLPMETATLAAAAALILVSVWCGGVPFALLGAAAAAVRRRSAGTRIAVIATSLFGVDVARSHSDIGVPWALLGHSQWCQPGIAQLAVVGGVPLVSFLLAGTNGATAELLRPGVTRERRRQAGWWLGAFVGACAGCLALGQPLVQFARESARADSAPSMQLLAIQTNLPAPARWDPDLQGSNLEALQELTQRELDRSDSKLSIVVWPESVITTPLDKRAALAEQLNKMVDGFGIPLVLGTVRSAPSRRPAFYRNSVVWIEPGAGLVADFDKTRGVPFVESNPTFPGASYLGGFLGLVHGPRIEVMTDERPLRGTQEFAVVLCYESVFPRLVQSRRSSRTLAILNLANDSWLQSESPSLQELAYTSFRAIEQRLPLVRVTDGGISASIDPYGRMVGMLPSGSEGSLSVPLAQEIPPTVRERVVLCVLLVTGGGLGGTLAAVLWRKRP